MIRLAFVLGTTLALSHAAVAAPAWCSGASDPQSSLADALSDDPQRGFRGIVAMQCFPRVGSNEDTPDVRAKVEASRQAYNTRFGLVDADWADIAGFASSRHDIGDIRTDKSKAWSTLDAIAQYGLLANVFGDQDPVYIADALDGQLTETGRMAYIAGCMKRDDVVAWAMCQPDIDAFDPKKIGDELRAATKHEPWERVTLRMELAKLLAKLDEHGKAVAARKEKDPAYGKMFEIAAATRKDWHADPALLALVLAMDDARATKSRRALAGCEDATWAAFKKAVAAIPASRFTLRFKDIWSEMIVPNAAVIAGDPSGYLATVALVTCNADANDIFVRQLVNALVFWPGYRGPRDATLLAIMNAALQLDERGATIRYPSIDRRTLLGPNDLSSNGGTYSPVKSVKAGPKTVHAEFLSTSSKEQKCMDYRPGKRISRIDSSGRFIYEGTCMKYAEVTVVHPPTPPKELVGRWAEALKAGMTALVMNNSLLIATAGASAKVPSIVFGVPVK